MVDIFRMAVKAFIRNEKGEILILKEADEYSDGTNSGKWQIPGGRIEPGESYDKALKREIKEETDLEIEIESPFTVGEWRPKIRGQKFQIVAVFFISNKTSGKVSLSEEHSDYKWIDPKNPPSLDFIGKVPERIDSYLENIESIKNE